MSTLMSGARIPESVNFIALLISSTANRSKLKFVLHWSTMKLRFTLARKMLTKLKVVQVRGVINLRATGRGWGWTHTHTHTHTH